MQCSRDEGFLGVFFTCAIASGARRMFVPGLVVVVTMRC